MTPLDLANHQTAHKSELGLAEIASRMGVGAQILTNKVNWATESNKLGQLEAIAMQLVTGSRDIIREECLLLGGEFTAHDGESGQSVMMAVLDAAAKHGDVGRVVADAMADGRICVREEAHIVKCTDEAIQALRTLRTAVLDLAQKRPST